MPRSGTRWKRRPWAARAIGLVALLIPVAAAVAAAAVASRLLPRPDSTVGTLAWWLAVLGLSTAVLVVVDRQTRRMLPLAALLKLSLVFPDRAPSRLVVALRAGTVQDLRRRVENGGGGALGDDPCQAAADILVLAAALNRHDRRTRGHSERVRAYVDLIAEEMHLTADEADRLRWAALLHDVGKIHVHPRILNKDGSLSPEEWTIIRRHPVEGAQLAAPLRPWLGPWVDAIEQHHERWDGMGYPNGLAGSEISLGARIVAVADAFEVMTAARSYRSTVGPAAAREELARCAGSHFDPLVVRAFLNLSIGRLRWVMAPLTWLAELPLVRPVTSAGGAVTESAGAALAAKAVATVSVALVGGTAVVPHRPPVPGVTSTAKPSPTPSPGLEGQAVGAGEGMGPPAPGGEGVPPTAEAPAPQAGPSAPVTAAAGASRGIRTGGPGPRRANQAPAAVDDSVTVPANRPVRMDVVGNDVDPDGNLDRSTLTIVDPPDSGTARVQGGQVFFRPGRDGRDPFRGLETFTYRICDSAGACSLATVSITVV